MNKKTDIQAVYSILEREFKKHRMPVVDLVQAQTRDPFKVLLSTIISARTKDETTTAASNKLFSVVHTPEDLAKIPVGKLEQLIYPVGFYKNKARHLKKLPRALNELYGGKVPDTVEELVQLPGVGRKTANLVVVIGFNKPAICVDVHVHRIVNRLGYLQTKTPFETEMKLREILPKKFWLGINSYLVSFGQHLCRPINPRCDICPIYTYCERIGVKTKYTK
ncbi:MAG: endonuclease III [Chitinivibrionales bacterium]|nr:endonuclease III [Chitinivibrionales bacterium]